MIARTADLRTILGIMSLLATGCGSELGPEQFATTRVHGVVKVGNLPVPGGFVEISPVEGAPGNLRVAPVGADGRFEVDRVPVGRVVVGFEQLPVPAIPTPSGPVERWRFRSNRGAIRRVIPPGPEHDLPIDLTEEAIRSRARPSGRPRRKKKAKGNSRRDLLDVLEAGPSAETAPGRSEPTVQVVYRDHAGSIHLHWPNDRLAEAIADTEGALWVDIEDLESANNGKVEAMLLDLFGFHPLAVQDALEDTHVPRVDDWGRYLYLVVNTVRVLPETNDLQIHEIDFFLGPNYLVSYHNESSEVLARHRRNLEREPEGRLRQGADHLLYRLLDELVDDFLPAIERLDDAIDDAQDEVFREPTPRTLRKIFAIKSSALQLHRMVIPVREVLNRLARDEYSAIHRDCRIYFRDVYDHLVRLHDILESLRDLISGAIDTYLSVVSNRTNDIMKALTVVNVMFLPLTFVVGFFGMNFFGDTLAFEWPPLPRTVLFWMILAAMIGTPVLFWQVARRRGWL